MIRPSNEQMAKFHQIFGLSLSRFWNPMIGFDLIKFDDKVKKHFGYVEDGKTSLSDFLRSKFGEDVRSFILDLIQNKGVVRMLNGYEQHQKLMAEAILSKPDELCQPGEKEKARQFLEKLAKKETEEKAEKI